MVNLQIIWTQELFSFNKKTQRLEILELKMTESRKKGSPIKAIKSMILIENETYSEEFRTKIKMKS